MLAAGGSSIAGADGGAALGFASSAAGVGLLMLLLRDLRVRNDELTKARAELARLAVAEERERFARDLHDLLGHTLSVIALKAELAERLLPERPGESAREIAEVEGVARTALSEVREAVSGLPPADARRRAHGRAHGVVGRRHRGRRRACRGLAGPRDRGGPGLGRP